jgi:hypothetical protein
MLIDDDIDEIIKRGEEKTAEINSKYAGLDLDVGEYGPNVGRRGILWKGQSIAISSEMKTDG